MWQEYLEQKSREVRKEDYYAAQIATEVRRSYARKGKSVKIKDFLLKFKTSKENLKTDKDLKTKVRRSKMFWRVFTGFNKKSRKK